MDWIDPWVGLGWVGSSHTKWTHGQVCPRPPSWFKGDPTSKGKGKGEGTAPKRKFLDAPLKDCSKLQLLQRRLDSLEYKSVADDDRRWLVGSEPTVHLAKPLTHAARSAVDYS